MFNAIWLALILIAIVCGAWTGRMQAVTHQSVMAAKAAVMLAIGLIGVMAFWLGMVQVAREAGLLRVLARALRPVMTRLFPDVPEDHPAMSAMIMNMASNMMGLGNAATPFGLKAMMELDKLNKEKGTATNAMALFLAINTSNIALFPTGVIGIRAAMGSQNPTGIIFTTLFATICSTCVAIFAAKTLQRLPRFRSDAGHKNPPAPSGHIGQMVKADNPSNIASATAAKDDTKATTEPESTQKTQEAKETEETGINMPTEEELGPTSFPPTPMHVRALQWLFWGSLLAAAVVFVLNGWLAHLSEHSSHALLGSSLSWVWAPGASVFSLSKDILSFWLLPALMASILLYGVSKGVRVYGALVVGAQEGWDVAKRIIPYLVAILVAVGMFRASGALDLMIAGISPLTNLIGMPAEALPMALLRPLSGSGAFGVMAESMQANGPDSLVGYMVSTFQGSTETTFYVMAVYFGAVQVKHVRHTLLACLIADLAGVIAAVWICVLMFG